MTDTKLSRTIASTATLKIANIHSEDLFYTPLEERFERITRVARRALQVPVAAITLLNDEKQWFKSAAGWGISELPRAHSICRLTIEENRLLTIPNLRRRPTHRPEPYRRLCASLSSLRGLPAASTSTTASPARSVYSRFSRVSSPPRTVKRSPTSPR